jgi:hypothetical protein
MLIIGPWMLIDIQKKIIAQRRRDAEKDVFVFLDDVATHSRAVIHFKYDTGNGLEPNVIKLMV